MRNIFGCCDDLVFTDPYERRPRHRAFDRSRGSRFLEVTSDPLNMASNKVPLIAKKNNTFGTQTQSRFDTRASESNHGEARKGLEYQQFKPRTPIGDLQCLIAHPSESPSKTAEKAVVLMYWYGMLFCSPIWQCIFVTSYERKGKQSAPGSAMELFAGSERSIGLALHQLQTTKSTPNARFSFHSDSIARESTIDNSAGLHRLIIPTDVILSGCCWISWMTL